MTEPTDQPPTLPDTSSWVRREPGDVIEAGTPLAGWHKDGTPFLTFESVDDLTVGEVDGVTYWTPPPAPSEPWSVISTDRDKPTDAWITYEVGDEDHRYLGQWWQDGDNLYRVQDNGQWGLGVTHVELLHTHNPETHVPVERALIDEVIRALVWLDDVRSPGSRDIDFRDVRGIVIALASLAFDESSASDGGRS